MATVLLICLVVTSVLGIVLHYVHKPSTRSVALHCFTPVNESTWEHLKLVFMPMLVLTFLQLFLLKSDYANIFEANLMGALVAIIFIPVGYYISLYIIKRHIFWVTIIIFLLAVCFGYVTTALVLTYNIVLVGEVIALAAFGLLLALFAVFTFFAPKNFLFKDPISKKHGHTL